MALQAEWTKITPAMAIEYLSHAAPNRRVRKHQVERYAKDMRAGQWLTTGQAILFTGTGELLDGQHRLYAIVESACTMEFLVIRGVSPAAMGVIDTGMARTFADSLSTRGLCGLNLAPVLAALTRRMALWDAGIRLQSGVAALLSHSELDTYLTAHPELMDYALYGQPQPRPVAASVMAYIYGQLYRLDPDKALQFCERMRYGDQLEAGSPILELRERMSGNLVGYHMPINQLSEIRVALTFLAWNIWREGRKVQKLQLPKGGLTNKNYPVPK